MSKFSSLMTDLQTIIISSNVDDEHNNMNVQITTTGSIEDDVTPTTKTTAQKQQQQKEDHDESEKTGENNKKKNFTISYCVDILQLLQNELMIDVVSKDNSNSNSNISSKSDNNDSKKEGANDKKRKSIDDTTSDADEIRNEKRLQKISSIDNSLDITLDTIVLYINILDKTQRTLRVMKRRQQPQQHDDNNNVTTDSTTGTNLRTVFDTALQYTKQIGRTLVSMEQYIQKEQKQKQQNVLTKNKRKRQYPLQEENVNEDSNESTTKKDDDDDDDDHDNKRNNNINKNSDKKKKPSISTTLNTNEKVDIPKNVTEYSNRLKKHSKELYKDPPVLPPINVTIDDEYMSIPKRDKKSGILHFEPSTKQKTCTDNKTIEEYFTKFTPNRTPEEILRSGSFGGTYYRPIHSAVTNIYYNNTNTVLQNSINMEWISGLDSNKFVTNPNYNITINKYKVKCGGSLGMWESSGWISSIDPYGWFQWYCRFYNGRRSSDDVRQIQRWIAVAKPGSGRFVSQLCNKILVACPKLSQINNISISPVIRQTLFHWGIIITTDIVNEHIQCKSKKLLKKK